MSTDKLHNYCDVYDDLVRTASKIRSFYDVNNIRWDSVYLGLKTNWWPRNILCITADDVIFYDDNHTIIEESKPIIREIQSKLKEIDVMVLEEFGEL